MTDATGGPVSDWPDYDKLLRSLSCWQDANSVPKEDPRHTQISACVYVTEETQSAIDSYRRTTAFSEDGEAFLKKYGLLQAVQLQLDAVSSLGSCLGCNLKMDKYDGVKVALNTRHTVAGHPIRSQTRGTKRHHFHDRISVMDPTVMRFMSFNAADPTEWRGETTTVDYLVNSVEAAVKSALAELADFLCKHDGEELLEVKQATEADTNG